MTSNTGPAANPIVTTEKVIFASPDPSANEPIVCTADLPDAPAVQAQMDGYRAAFAQLERTERFTRGFRWIFTPKPGLEGELRTLAENEHRCCRFFKFDVRTVGDSVVWETTSDERAAAVLEEFARLPAVLKETQPGQDAAQLRQSAGSVGLVFAAERRALPPRART